MRRALVLLAWLDAGARSFFGCIICTPKCIMEATGGSVVEPAVGLAKGCLWKMLEDALCFPANAWV